MKILMLNDNLVKGGRERRLLELLKGLSDYPHIQCELVIFSNRIAYPEVHEMGIPLHIVERKPSKDPRVFFRLFRICCKFKPDIIHSWSSMASIYALPSVKMLGIKLLNAMIMDGRTNLGWTDAHWMRARLTFPFSDAVLANSRIGLRSYEAPSNRSHCLHNGFDFNRVARLEPALKVREQFGIRTPYVVGMVGAFEERKDFPLYLDAAMEILNERDDVTFMAIGDGSQLPDCRERVPQAFKNHIIFTGNQHHVESIINIFDIGVLVTNRAKGYQEGISNVILEYMALGKPVVAYQDGGTPEIVVEGETGLLVQEAKASVWARKIKTLIDDPQLAISMGAAGKQRVKEHFNLEKMTSAYFDLYRRLLLYITLFWGHLEILIDL